jgi:hypothetical protein
MALLNKVSRGKGIADEVARSEALVCLKATVSHEDRE